MQIWQDWGGNLISWTSGVLQFQYLLLRNCCTFPFLHSNLFTQFICVEYDMTGHTTVDTQLLRRIVWNRLHRWLIETAIVLVLFNFTYTLNRTTTESINSQMLQDLAPSARYQLTSEPQWGLGDAYNSSARQPCSQPHRKDLGLLRSWGALRLPAAWNEAGTQLPHQNKDFNSSSTPNLPRDDKLSNCAISSKPSGMSHVFRKFCLSLNRDFSKKPNQPKTNPPKKNKNPNETKKQKNHQTSSGQLIDVFVRQQWIQCHSRQCSHTQPRIRCMILLSENKCLRHCCILHLQKTSLRYQWKRCYQRLKQWYILTLLTCKIERSVIFGR